MKKSANAAPQFAICVDSSGYPASLELHKIYRVLLDPSAQDGELRIIDESGEDYLYPARRFILIHLPQKVARILTRQAIKRRKSLKAKS
ncbi:MAG: hypothetical protein HY717_01005 [Planctomycetes bacterium]|nr:hypothetical protein [Planctomycetota bacterium]